MKYRIIHKNAESVLMNESTEIAEGSAIDYLELLMNNEVENGDTIEIRVFD